MRLAPYIVTFGLLGSALAWQGTPAWFGHDAGIAPKVVVANYGVPSTEAAAPDASPSPEGPDGAAGAAGEPAPAEDGGYVIAELPQQTIKPFSLVGVTWASGMPATAEIQVQWHGTGGWSEWTDLHQDLVPVDDGPGRPGTEPQWVDWADGIAVRVTNAEPATPVDLQVSAVTGSAASDSDVIAPMAATQPGIILREQWGARAASNCASPQYGPSTQGAVIHHTVNKNTYTAAESPGIVRSIQAYHMASRDWCDIGYNFLVDRFGQVFEGRGGGIDQPVRAAHSGNAEVNEQTMGVSLMGTFTSEDATPEMKAATANLVSWRFSLAGIPAKGAVSIGGKSLERISGHRDVVSTACPGEYVFAWLGATGGLRDQVEQILATGVEPAPPAAPDPAVPDPAVEPVPEAPAPTEVAPQPVVQPVQPAVVTVPTGLKVAKRRATYLKFVWVPVPGAKKYEVRVSREKSMSYPKVQDSSDSDEKVKVRASGQRYYAQVRAVRPDGSKTSWSDKVKTSTKRR